ncbi:MAG TPA: hypothetical protein VG146_08985 [Verrucomicrobiae bacterium]|nr:hypothetical protein [Verrucomicrobiae bacterium]
MKFIRTAKGRFLFQLGQRERALFLGLLGLYPRVFSAHQPLSKKGRMPNIESSQQLLDEALAEQRAENKKLLEALLADPKRWAENQAGWRLAISASEIEWLLQILNDIRVGSWVLLGSPEEPLRVLNEQSGPQVWAMEMAGAYQMFFLHALGET